MLHDWAGPTCIKRLFMTFPKIVLSEDFVIAKGIVTGVSSEREVTCDIWLERDGVRLLDGNATIVFSRDYD